MLFKERWTPLVVAVLLAAGTWTYVYGVLNPARQADGVVEPVSRGNRSDLYPPWLGARELLLHGRDPYSAEVTAEIQLGYYGHTLDPRNPADPRNEQRFAYPLYTVFLLAPTIFSPFELVQRAYLLFSLIFSAASVLLWAQALAGQIRWQGLAAGMIVMLGSFPVVQALFLQQLTLLVAALLAGAAAAVAAGALGVAGGLLALAMIKPQLTLPVTGWLLVWAVSDWRARKELPLAFIATMACLLVGAELLLPGWIWRWRDVVSAYSRYTGATTPVPQLFFGPYLGGFLWVAVLATLLGFGWQMRRHAADTDGFKLALVCVLCGTVVLTPTWYLHSQVFLLPAALLGVLWRHEFWYLSGARQVGVGILACLLVWPWGLAFALAVIALVSPATAQRATLAPLIPIVLNPIVVLVGMILLGAHRIRRKPPVLARADTPH
jgi:hypothetical protein